MKIFDLIRTLKDAVRINESDYSDQYVAGYRDCLSDLSGRIEDSIEVIAK